ncbi:MAG: hypothetical protein ACE5K2_07665 [Candidatus Zixiibacteriota bacterium]
MRLDISRLFEKKMNRKGSKSFLSVWLLLGTAVFSVPEAFAGSSSRIAAHSFSGFLPTLLDVLILFGILFCFFASLKVKSFLKEGELAYGWILFSLSFAILFISQLFSLSVSSGLLDIPFAIVSLTRFLFILSLALGIYFMKKLLS